MNPDLEVLAPAGSFEILKAVIEAGADAVYVGGPQYGARAYANNFSQEELLEAIDYAHIRGCKVYLTVNTLFKEEETRQLYAYLKPFYLQGLDAVLVQDFGVLTMIHEWFADLPIHTSTQMTVTGVDGVRLLQSYGVTRVVMARELSLAEMKEIHQQTGIELEAFVHGALCYCYSGQCLFSSMLGGRSGNRGRCAQPCRLPYTVMDENQKMVKNDSYILSMKDLCGIKELQKLKEAGVYSLKIEGRMKQLSYAAGVVSYYRKYADCCRKDAAHAVSVQKEDEQDLFSLGNRCGFTNSYFYQQNSEQMITYEKPSFVQRQGESKPARWYQPINGIARFQVGIPAQLTIVCGQLQVKVTGDCPQVAFKQPMKEEDVRQRLKKTKDTAFEFTDLQIQMEDNVFLPNGALNQLRRQAITALEEAILQKYRRRMPAGEQEKHPNFRKDLSASKEKMWQVVSVMKRSQLDSVLKQEWVSAVYIDVNAYQRKNFWEACKEDIEKCRDTGKQVYLIFPSIFRQKTMEYYKNHIGECRSLQLDGIVVKNYESLGFVKNYLPELTIITDHNLYTCNSTAAEAFYQLGAAYDTVPFELNRHEIMARDNRRSQMIVYGYYPLMISAQCVHKNTAKCDRTSCVLYLKDRYQKQFPVQNYCNDCYNIIYNSVPTMLFGQLGELKEQKFGGMRLSFTIEEPDEVSRILQLYEAAFRHPGQKVLEEEKAQYTNGHYKRGVE